MDKSSDKAPSTPSFGKNRRKKNSTPSSANKKSRDFDYSKDSEVHLIHVAPKNLKPGEKKVDGAITIITGVHERCLTKPVFDQGKHAKNKRFVNACGIVPYVYPVNDWTDYEARTGYLKPYPDKWGKYWHHQGVVLFFDEEDPQTDEKILDWPNNKLLKNLKKLSYFKEVKKEKDGDILLPLRWKYTVDCWSKVLSDENILKLIRMSLMDHGNNIKTLQQFFRANPGHIYSFWGDASKIPNNVLKMLAQAHLRVEDRNLIEPNANANDNDDDSSVDSDPISGGSDSEEEEEDKKLPAVDTKDT